MDNTRSFITKSLRAANITATGAGTEVDLKSSFLSPAKREMAAILTAFAGGGNVASDTFALDVKLQESSTTVDSDFVDITSATFTQITEATTTGTPETIYFQTKALTRYVRDYATVTGGTGTCTIVEVCNIRVLSRIG